jgi:hypothetical protein
LREYSMERVHRWVSTRSMRARLLAAAVGSFLILFGLASDLSWVQRMANALMADGFCSACQLLCNTAWVFLPLLGAIMIIAAVRGFGNPAGEAARLETVLAASVLFALILYLASSQVRHLGNDEYEHMHNAWMMQEGTIPYFTIASTHSPLLEWIILAFIKVMGESAAIIQAMRTFTALLSAGSLYLVYRLAKEVYDSRAHGLTAVLVLLCSFVWMEVSFEVRPDNLMLFFVLAASLFLLRYRRTGRRAYGVLFLCCCVLSLLGKQNAAVFLLGLAVAFLAGIPLDGNRNPRRKIATLIAVLVVVAGSLSVGFVRSFLWINITRHLLPNQDKFFPTALLMQAFGVSPAIFLLFFSELFHRSGTGSRETKRYLYCVCFVCLAFLFLMNRPFVQEMLVMSVAMSIIGSDLLVALLQRLKPVHVWLMIALVGTPYLNSVANTVDYSAYPQIETTRTILDISKRSDLVLDAYGQAIFRHSPLEPRYLIYFPKRFSRLEVLKTSGTQFVIWDTYYFPALQQEVRDWIADNFTPSDRNPSIMVRRPPGVGGAPRP